MPLRPYRVAAGLANCPICPTLRGASRFSAIRSLDRVRFNSSSSGTSNDSREPNKQHRKNVGPKKRRRFRDANLGNPFLGEPGKILLVPYRDRRKPKGIPNQGINIADISNDGAEDGDGTQGVSPILGEYENHEGTVETGTVFDRIESFRIYPPNSYLEHDEWKDLRIKIRNSFTVTQLSAYLAMAASNGRQNQDATGWKPGTSEYLEADSAHGSVTKRIPESRALKGKAGYAERIFREIWHLGLVDEIGQQDIRVPSHRISLLLNSENFSFEELASLHDARIDIASSHDLIRVTGMRRTCEAIVEIVNDATQRIREEEFENDPRADANFQNAFPAELLDWASKSHEVSFELNSRHYPSKILYLVENRKNAQSARQTLNLATYQPRSVIPFCTYLSADEPASVFDVEAKSKVSYFDRQREWFRWAMSSTQSTEWTNSDRHHFDTHSQQARLSDVLLDLIRGGASPASSKGDGAGFNETITAAVGKCLFMRKPSMNQRPVKASQLGNMSLPRTFITDIPHTTSLLRDLSLYAPENDAQHHRIRLSPTAVNADAFPELELELAVTEPKDSPESGDTSPSLALRSAKAIMTRNEADFLVPEAEMDLRFIRTIHYDLLNGSHETPAEEQPARNLEETMSESLQGILTKDYLSLSAIPMPSFCRISLPRHIVKGGAAMDSDNLAGHVTGEYMFQPMSDARGSQIHSYNFRNRQLNYMDYESGPFLPDRTTELFLDFDLTGRSLDSEQVPGSGSEQISPTSAQKAMQLEFRQFYKTACQLVFEVDGLWRTDYARTGFGRR